VSLKVQSSLETAIILAFSLLLLVGLIYYLSMANNNNLQYETTPFVLSSLEFYNFQTMGSTCSFDFAFQTNSYLPYPNYELSFILNNGQRIVPEYNVYSESVTPVLSSGYQYTFSLNGVPNYNGSVCSVMGQQSVNHAYVKYVSYKNVNGKIVVQPVSTNYVFKINSASTLPNQLYNNNTILISGSVIPYSGYVYISYQNKTSVPDSPFTLGEYVYLPTGNYSISYTNESDPVAFQYWSSSGGVIIQNIFNITTNMTVINNGEIYLNLRNFLKPSQTFIIYSNKTYSISPGKFNITANFIKSGYYTYYVNNQPYSGCVNVAQTSCVMSFNTAGSYTISATFKNSTTFAEATPIQVYVFNPLSATLSSNETVAQNKTNVLLSVDTYNGLQPFTYSFYANNAPIENCIDISTQTCTYNIDNTPNDYIYNYEFTANVSDTAGELVTTNNVIVEGVVAVPIILYNSQTQATLAPFQQMIQINETQNPFNGIIIYNKSFANFDFRYQNGTVVPAWIESNQSGKLTIWVKLANGIPANSKTTIYLKFARAKNLLSQSGTSGIGEAPQLSCPNPDNTTNCPTYAEYDDGSSIFNDYWNFEGTYCPFGWTCTFPGEYFCPNNYICSGVIINNGITLPFSSYAYTTSDFGYNTNTIVDFYGNFPPAKSGFNAAFGFVEAYSGNAGVDVGWTLNTNNNQQWTTNAIGQTGLNENPGGYTTGIPGGVNTTGYHVYSIYYTPSFANFSYDYGRQTKFTTDLPHSAYPLGGINAQRGIQSTPGPFYWLRVRDYPPNGVMPSVTIIS